NRRVFPEFAYTGPSQVEVRTSGPAIVRATPRPSAGVSGAGGWAVPRPRITRLMRATFGAERGVGSTGRRPGGRGSAAPPAGGRRGRWRPATAARGRPPGTPTAAGGRGGCASAPTRGRD